jgi:hypothetical protein
VSTAVRPITDTAQCTLIVKPEVDYKPEIIIIIIIIIICVLGH